MNALRARQPVGRVVLAVAAGARPGGLGRASAGPGCRIGRHRHYAALPYVRKLFRKDAALATRASPLFRSTPYIVSTMAMAAAIIPSVTTDLPMGTRGRCDRAGRLFRTARVFMALAAMDIGTVFGAWARGGQ